MTLKSKINFASWSYDACGGTANPLAGRGKIALKPVVQSVTSACIYTKRGFNFKYSCASRLSKTRHSSALMHKSNKYKNQSINQAYFEVRVSNTPAVALYKRFGFEVRYSPGMIRRKRTPQYIRYIFNRNIIDFNLFKIINQGANIDENSCS